MQIKTCAQIAEKINELKRKIQQNKMFVDINKKEIGRKQKTDCRIVMIGTNARDEKFLEKQNSSSN